MTGAKILFQNGSIGQKYFPFEVEVSTTFDDILAIFYNDNLSTYIDTTILMYFIIENKIYCTYYIINLKNWSVVL